MSLCLQNVSRHSGVRLGTCADLCRWSSCQVFFFFFLLGCNEIWLSCSGETILTGFYLLGKRHFPNLIIICPKQKLCYPIRVHPHIPRGPNSKDYKCLGTVTSVPQPGYKFHLTGPMGDFLGKHNKGKSLRPWNPGLAAPGATGHGWRRSGHLSPLSPHTHSIPPRFNEASGQELGFHSCPLLPRMPLLEFCVTFLYLVCGCEWVCPCTCGSENNLLKPGLFFYHVCLGDQTQVRRLGGKHLYPLNHITGPVIHILL